MAEPFPTALSAYVEFPPGDHARLSSFAWKMPTAPLVNTGSATVFRAVSGIFCDCARNGTAYGQISRASLYVNNITREPPTLPLGPATVPMFFRLYVVGGGRRSLVASFTWSPPTWDDLGLLVTYSGHLCEGFEVWGRVDVADPENPNLNITLRWIVDRIENGTPGARPGPNVVIT